MSNATTQVTLEFGRSYSIADRGMCLIVAVGEFPGSYIARTRFSESITVKYYPEIGSWAEVPKSEPQPVAFHYVGGGLG